MNTSQLTQARWQDFADCEHLSNEQLLQFKRYMALLLQWNKLTNLTAIINPADILADHFQDSLRVGDVVDFSTIQRVADVGTGGGFPGIPLKIKYPHLKMILLEVNTKKIEFLKEVIYQLKLTGIEVSSLDWRTFLRTEGSPLDLVCARASLQPDELVRMFSPVSPYKNSRLVYWASAKWLPEKKVEPLIVNDVQYTVGAKVRRLIFFALSRDTL